MSFWDSFVTLLGLGELCLLALFHFGLLARFGGCQVLVVLLIWLLLELVLCGRLLLMVVVGKFSGLVLLVRDRKEFDLPERTLHTSQLLQFNAIMCGWFASVSIPDHRRRRLDQDGEYILAQVRRVFLVIRPNTILHFAPYLSTHFFPCLNSIFKNGSFLSVVALVSVTLFSFESLLPPRKKRSIGTDALLLLPADYDN